MIYISIGSNIGDRLANLRKAVKLIKKNCMYDVIESIIIENHAILPENSPTSWNQSFLNMIIAGKTTMSPQNLLKHLQEIEIQLNRDPSHIKYAPRTIDLDVILWDDLVIQEKNLTVPHQEINNRPFLQHLLSLMNVKPWCDQYSSPSAFSASLVLNPAIVGVVNVTEDSFSDGGSFSNTDKAIAQIYQLIKDGASIIEIGAQSTKPGALIKGAEKEYKQLQPILKELPGILRAHNVQISIDTFWDEVVLRALKDQHPIDIINDVKGHISDDTLKIIAEYDRKFCFMHSLDIPPKKENVIPFDQDIIVYLKKWGQDYIDKLMSLGFSVHNMILDVGIGFGKTAIQNLKILQNIAQMQELNVPIMLGASRKSYISSFSTEILPQNRDIETIAISLALQKKVDFIRVHNVKDHMRALVADHVVQAYV